MGDKEKRQAWADFWSNEQAPGSAGCLAHAGDELAAAQRRIWEQFAADLPKRARVLDLGTGDAIVLKRLRGVRRDLQLTGVDSAPGLPSAGSGIALKSGVAMEALPFAESSFDAVTSQFGYEYADTAEAAREVARILRPSGRFLFLVHRREGPVVAHNQARAAALRWAAFESGQIERARALAGARRAAALPTPPGFRDAANDARRRFPDQSVAWEITQAIVQALDPSLSPDASLAYLGELERKAKFELLRLEALAAAARDDIGARALAHELRDAGLEADDPVPLDNRSGQKFAWLLSGRGTSR